MKSTKDNLKFKINDFEGPLDLMLEMFKKNKLEVDQINIEYIIDQYLEFIENIKLNNYTIATEYLEFAAELVLYKSKIILAEEDEEDEEMIDVNDFVEQILEYKRYKEVSKKISLLEEGRQGYLTKKETSIKNEVDQELETIEINKFLLLAKKILEENSQDDMHQINVRQEMNIQDIVKDLSKLNYLNVKDELEQRKSKRNKIAFFLAILELVKLTKFTYEIKDDNIYIYQS